MARADMTEGIQHAFMRQDAVGERQFLDKGGYFIEHNFPRFGSLIRGRLRKRPANVSSGEFTNVEGADGPLQAFEV